MRNITVSPEIVNDYTTKIIMTNDTTGNEATGTVTYLADGHYRFHANTREKPDWIWNDVYLNSSVNTLLDILQREVALTAAQISKEIITRNVRSRLNMKLSSSPN